MDDKNFRVVADTDNVVIKNEVIIPPDDTYQDALKFSNADHCIVHTCTIFGGTEDCIDLNRGSIGNFFTDIALEPHGKYGVTIKGGSNDTVLQNVLFETRANEYDIDIGNWSDQSDAFTTGTILTNVYASDREPVRVRVLWGAKPQVNGGNVKVTVVPLFLVKAYRWLRKRNLVK